VREENIDSWFDAFLKALALPEIDIEMALDDVGDG